MTEPIPNPPPSRLASRRRFIQVGIAAVAAAWAGTGVQSALFPQPGVQEAVPVEFPLADLPVGATREIVYAGTAAVVVRSAESIKAYSLICTHLGCLVRWEAGKQEFYCPCHDGRFDRFGEVIAGPPPLPLEQFAVRVEGDRVIVGEA